MTAPRLTAIGLTKEFGRGSVAVQAVRGVDLDVAAGEVVLVDGPSGSGKTTLLLMLGGMLRPTTGSVTVDSDDVWALPEGRLPGLRARRFGFVFQDFNLLAALSVTENVELAANLAGTTGKAARDAARAVLERVSLGHRVHFHPDQLSGGEKQRVAVARALVNNPGVILADEPTANLDSANGHAVGQLLRRLANEDGRSVIIVTHDGRLHDIANRVVWLEDGTLRTLDTLHTDPVCGMTVTPADKPHLDINGRVWWFCSPNCREEFRSNPAAFQPPPANSHVPQPRPS